MLDSEPRSLEAAECRDDDDKTVFRGWARMALPIEQFSIIEVRKPNVGENKPAGVEADIIIDTKGATFRRQCSIMPAQRLQSLSCVLCISLRFCQ